MKRLLVVPLLFAGCSAPPGPGDSVPEVLRGQVIHRMATYDLAPFEEATPCLAWTLDNEQPLYVNAVITANDGGWHHSNWYVVPDEYHPGPDGWFPCDERGVNDAVLASEGSVLYAQSTQSFVEEQRLAEGVVIKVPAYSRIVAGAHLLNLSSRRYETEMQVTLEVIHPKTVKSILTPFVLINYALEIAPQAESRFRGECDIAEAYESALGQPFEMKLHYVLPHFHYLGNYFGLEILGGPRGGEMIYELEGFNGDANGRTFIPPIDLSGSTGLAFTCGYLNDTNQMVGYGIGDQEMCVMLGLAETDARFLVSVFAGNNTVRGVENGIVMNDGRCGAAALPQSDDQGMPTDKELEAPLYLPASDGDGRVAVPQCADTPAGATPAIAARLSAIQDDVFLPSCSFNACHGGNAPAAGLALDTGAVHAELLGHTVKSDTALPLVAPGDPEGSWLYRRLAECEPTDDTGKVLAHMPLNSVKLLDEGVVAAVREWIALGALDD